MFGGRGRHSPSFYNGFQITKKDGTKLRYDRVKPKTDWSKPENITVVVHQSGGLLKAQFMVQNLSAEPEQIAAFVERITEREVKHVDDWYFQGFNETEADRKPVTAVELTRDLSESDKQFKQCMLDLGLGLFEEFKQKIIVLRLAKIGAICGESILE